MNTARAVYKIVKSIPRGKVMTYGQIAEVIQKSNIKNQNDNAKFKITSREVGRVLHLNPDPKNIPCHRVVNAKGRLAEHYAFGGLEAQRKKLIAEGVEFKNPIHVKLK